jgi:hypothetical protein
MSEDELYQQAMQRIREIIRKGTGAVEIKSGYGLNTDDELKMLRVIRRIRQTAPLCVRSTFLGAHAVGRAYQGRQADYVDLIIHEMIPEVARQQLRRDSPRTHGGRGHYWSGWRVDSKQLDSYGVNGTRAVVYNYNKPTLTHLLERGHDIVRGGRGRRGVVVGHAEGIPHIGRAREAALRHLTQRGW